MAKNSHGIALKKVRSKWSIFQSGPCTRDQAVEIEAVQILSTYDYPVSCVLQFFLFSPVRFADSSPSHRRLFFSLFLAICSTSSSAASATSNRTQQGRPTCFRSSSAAASATANAAQPGTSSVGTAKSDKYTKRLSVRNRFRLPTIGFCFKQRIVVQPCRASPVMGKFEHGNLLVSLTEGHRHGYSLTAVAVGLGVGIAGLCKALHSSLAIPWILRKLFSESERVYYTGGLRNLGNNCFLNVILQALASCDHFVSSLDDLLGSDDVLPEEQSERMPLIFALSSLLEDLSTVRDERTVLNPQGVMHALRFYVSHFNLTRQQDASEAFGHLLTSVRDEISHCYVPYKSSLADITMFHSKVYKQREGNQSECKRWKQNIFGPFDGTIGSTLSCRNCSSVLSLDFENFHCLPLSPVPDINGDIINGCSLVDCLKHFTVLEQLDNYRCDRCWHNAAAKYFSLKSEVDKEKVNQLRTCVDYDSCSCKQLFGSEKTKWSVSSKATKQLAITRCPKILCIHLLRASVSMYGDLVKRGGHISFPVLLDLSPFAGGTFSTGQGPGPSAMNTQIYDLSSLHLYRQLNTQMPINMFPTGGNSSSQPRKDEVSNGGSCSFYKGKGDVATSTSSSWSTSISPRKELYTLSAVVEHYGICGGGHYAVYRRVASNPDVNDLARPRGKHWVYISDDHVSQVSEADVLAAEATLLFYERL